VSASICGLLIATNSGEPKSVAISSWKKATKLTIWLGLMLFSAKSKKGWRQSSNTLSET
jgi:hypothetical protein